MFVITSVHADAPTPTSVRYCYNFHVLVTVGVGFLGVQPGFLQLLPTQTWVKCASLDSPRCVVYSGVKFKAIRASIKN